MPRPRKMRCCRRYRADRVFKPQGIPFRDISTTVLSLDQFEALRLCDAEQLDQQEAGRRMGISRGTVQRLLYGARKSVIEAIMNNDAIVVNLIESETDNAGMYSNQGKPGARRRCK